MREIIDVLLLAGINTVAGNGFDLLIPQPHEVVPGVGQCKLPAGLGFSDEFKDERLSLLISRISPGNKPVQGGFLTIKKVAMPKGDEAYELKITPSGVEVSAAASAGAYYALKTLEQLTRGGAPIPCGVVCDWPDLSFRGVHLMCGGYFTPTIDMLRLMVKELPDLKYNKLVLEYDEKFPSKQGSHDVYTRDELIALVKLGQENFIEIIPLLDSLGHMEPYLWPKENVPLREQPDKTSEMCPQNPEALKFIKGLWSEALPLHPDSAYAHITGDEAFQIQPCPKCQPYAATGRQGELFCSYYTDLSRWMISQGKTPLMWGDMFLKHPEALEGFPRDVVICDWDYAGPEGDLNSPRCEFDPKGGCDSKRRELLSPYWRPNARGGYDPFPTLKFFGDQGFKTIACPAACWNRHLPHSVSRIFFFNNQRFALEAKQQNKTCLGLLNTVWTFQTMPGFWFGVAAGGDYSWNCRQESFASFVQRFAAGFLRRPDWAEPLLQLADVADYRGNATPAFAGSIGPGATPMAEEVAKLLAFSAEFNTFTQTRRKNSELVFRSAAAGQPEPLDLGKTANHTLKDSMPFKSRGLTTPPGEHTYADIPFKLDGQHVISLSTMAGDSVTFPLNRKLSGLVFWDAGFNVFPELPIARMKANYADGSQASFDFIGGNNIFDWTGAGREPKDKSVCVAAWRGNKDSSEDLVSWLTHWRNPRPEAELTSIELTAQPTGKDSHLVVLGITALTGGSPKDPPPVPSNALPDLESRAKGLYQGWVKPAGVKGSVDFLLGKYK